MPLPPPDWWTMDNQERERWRMRQAAAGRYTRLDQAPGPVTVRKVVPSGRLRRAKPPRDDEGAMMTEDEQTQTPADEAAETPGTSEEAAASDDVTQVVPDDDETQAAPTEG